MRPAALLLALLLAPAARAEDDPDTEVAKRRFAAGAELYSAGRYTEAARAFAEAARARPSPLLDFNEGRARDRAGDWAGAAEAYGRYLSRAPGAADAAEVRARVAELGARLVAPNKPESAPAVTQLVVIKPRRWVAPGVLAGGSAALFAAGAGLLGSAATDYARLQASCAPGCSEASWSGSVAAERAGWALVGVGAAVAVVDAVLWVRATRRRR